METIAAKTLKLYLFVQLAYINIVLPIDGNCQGARESCIVYKWGTNPTGIQSVFGQQPSFRSANLLPFNEYNPPLSQGKTAGRLVTNQKPKAIPDKQ